MRSWARAALAVFVAQGGLALGAERDGTLVWMGSEWGKCEPREFVRSDGECPVPSAPGRRVLPNVPCKDLTWYGSAVGGGLGCHTTCTNVGEAKEADLLASQTICPGDVVCREGYRFLGVGGVAMLDAPKGSPNCWRLKMKKQGGR